MTTRTISILAPLAVGRVQAAPLPKELNHPEYARIQGLWTFETNGHGGREVGGGRWLFEKGSLFAGGRNTTDHKEPNSVHGDPKNAEAIKELGTDFVTYAH